MQKVVRKLNSGFSLTKFARTKVITGDNFIQGKLLFKNFFMDN